MTDLNQVKTDIQAADKAAKDFVNRPASWISRNPGITSWGIIGLIMAMILLALKACT